MLIEQLYRIEKLRRHELKKLTQRNAPIEIEDIYAIPRLYGIGSDRTDMNGEFKRKSPYDSRHFPIDLFRMKDCIDALSNIVNKYHETQNFERQGESLHLKQSAANKITRLLTPEFFFYTWEDPLYQSEYGLLIEIIEKIASKLHENLHLLLATFPVSNAEEGVLNYALYVECGPQPKITQFVKAYSSATDPVYGGYENVTRTDHEKVGRPLASMQLKANHSGAIPYGSIVRGETAGGASFSVNIDICLDHKYGLAKNILDCDIALATKGLTYLPTQTTHILTSNTYPLRSTSVVARVSEQVDPHVTLSGNLKEDFNEKFTSSLAKNPYTDERKKTYTASRLAIRKGEISLSNLSFGHEVTLVKTKVKPMSQFTSHFFRKVKHINESVLDEEVIRQIHSMQNSDESIILCDIKAYQKLKFSAGPIFEVMISIENYLFENSTAPGYNAINDFYQKFRLVDMRQDDFIVEELFSELLEKINEIQNLELIKKIDEWYSIFAAEPAHEYRVRSR